MIAIILSLGNVAQHSFSGDDGSVLATRNLFFSDFLVQLQRAATLYGYNGIGSYLDENANEIDAAEKILREIKPKGMIFLGGSVANFKKDIQKIII